MDPGKFFLYLFLGFIAGCLVFAYSLATLFLLVWLYILARHYKLLSKPFWLLSLVVLIGVTSGLYWSFAGTQAQQAGREAWSGLYGTKIQISGRICSEPDRRQDQQKLILCTVKGKVLLSTALYPEYSYGESLRATGTLKVPVPIEDFRYDRYLALSDIYALIYFPQLQKTEDGVISGWREFLLGLKTRATAALAGGLAEPESGLAQALVLGYKNTVSDAALQDFAKSGLSHLIAISGTHITVLSGGLFYLWLLVGGSRRNFLGFFLIIIISYIWLSGGAAAAWRAALMGSGAALAVSLGRPYKILPWLVAAAAVSLFWQPFSLRDDPGWQLSFLSLLGILVLLPLFMAREQGTVRRPDIRRNKNIQALFDYIKENFYLTLCSQIITLPLNCGLFGGIPLLAPIANLAVAWIFSPLFLYLLIMIAPAIIFPALSGWLLAPAQPALAFIYAVGALTSRADNLYLSASAWPETLVVCYYGFLAWIICCFLKRKTRDK